MINNFKKKLICWGAGDQCEVIRPIIEDLGSKFDLLVDDTPGKVSPFSDIELLGGKEQFEKWAQGRSFNDYGFVLAIGNPYGHIRLKLHEYLEVKGLTPVSFADPSSIIDKNVIIGDGAQIMRGAYINTNVSLGKQCILNTKSLVEHHCLLGNGVEIGPSSTLCGRVKIDDCSWIGANSTILPRLSVSQNTIVGAGSVVTKSITENHSVYFGNPAKYKKQNLTKRD